MDKIKKQLQRIFSAQIRVFPASISLGEALAAAILVAGAILCIVGYTASALWYYEFIPLYRVGLPFWEMLTNLPDVRGFKSAPLEQVPHHRAWVIYLVADEIPPNVSQRLLAYLDFLKSFFRELPGIFKKKPA